MRLAGQRGFAVYDSAMPRGRPPEDGEKRTRKLECKVMQAQLDAYDAAAELAGMTRSEWVRARLDEAAERETRRRPRQFLRRWVIWDTRIP